MDKIGSQTISSIDPANPPIDVLIPSHDHEINLTAIQQHGRMRKRFGARDVVRARAAAIHRIDRDKRDADRNLIEERERRTRSVQLYRTYRDGELPDVQM